MTTLLRLVTASAVQGQETHKLESSQSSLERTAAPVALFVYARPDHTERTIEALAANEGAAETALFCFSDAARRPGDAAAVEEVRRLVRAVKGFKSVTVIERTENMGLARNIVDGVSMLMEQFGKAIVVEDDLVTGPYFLAFMNDALDRYASVPDVWHVNGWTYPLPLSDDGKPFFTSIMECWGWATWADRWQHFRKDPDDLLQRWPGKFDITRFNIDNTHNYWADIQRNAHGTKNTWAVFWYATIFERGGLCLAPAHSHVVNIGIDGSGENSGGLDIYAAVTTSRSRTAEWPDTIAEDKVAWARIRDFLYQQRPPLWRRFGSRLKWWMKRVRR